MQQSRLVGKVVFEHEGALMYCDSARSFDKTNSLKAYSNVHMNQGDSLFLWGDFLNYSGDTKLALVTGDSVRLKDDKVELFTPRLNLDRKTNVAYYTTGGRIINDENRLKSRTGYYNTASKVFVFQRNVVLTNPRYVIESDTLRYDSEARFAYFEGPTTITSDSSLIYTENGLYNTVTDIAQFRENTFLYDENKVLSGDSMYYEKTNDFGQVFGNMVLHDTVDDYILAGNYGEYLGSIDSAFVTEEPIYSLIDKDEGDTLHIHGDTLISSVRITYMFNKIDSPKKDTLQKSDDSLRLGRKADTSLLAKNTTPKSDTAQATNTALQSANDSLNFKNPADSLLKKYRQVLIFNKVRFFKTSIQGSADSMTYNTLDSAFKMYYNPVTWNDSTQITGDTIIMTTRNDKLDSLKVFGNAFIVSIVDSLKTNQIKGRTMYGRFSDNALTRVYVNGNGQSLYYARKEDKSYIGLNRSLSANIIIKFKDKQVSTIGFLKKPEAILYPMKDITSDLAKLEGLKMRFTERPTKKADIFK